MVLTAALTGCGVEVAASQTGSGSNAESGQDETSSTSPSGTLVDARTTAAQKNQMCSAPTVGTVEESVYAPILTAHGAVTIRDARVVGDGVTLLDSQAAVLRGDPGNAGQGSFEAWPPKPTFRDDFGIDEETLTAFVGMTVDDGQSVLPFFRFAFEPDSRLRALEVDYDDGTGTIETLDIDFHFTHARDIKGC